MMARHQQKHGGAAYGEQPCRSPCEAKQRQQRDHEITVKLVGHRPQLRIDGVPRGQIGENARKLIMNDPDDVKKVIEEFFARKILLQRNGCKQRPQDERRDESLDSERGEDSNRS